jgi:aldehyde:ferredoxin oxidoreductase
MAYGYMGKILMVDLSKGEINEEIIPDEIYEKYTSGVGLASWLLYHRIPAGADPLGPDNIIGIVTGLLTGTGALFTGRWAAVGKSPLTGGWGDANGGGKLAPALKRSGYDGIFFKGKSEKPVYLKVIDGKAELVDASSVWGKDVVEADELIKEEIGKKVQTALIGSAGEKISLISGIVNDKARIAARSGLGAVMGSKNLKGIAVTGKQKAQVKDPQKVKQITDTFMKWFNKGKFLNKITTNRLLTWTAKLLRINPVTPHIPGEVTKIALDKWGTISANVVSSEIGDSPVKNWKGAGYKDYPISTHADKVNPQRIVDYQKKKYKCFSCPLGCGGILDVNDGPYQLGETHKPEYEAVGTLGTLLLNNDLHSIFKMNDMLNRAGMDCIGAGVTVAWAMECYEKGILTKDELDGIDLVWGDADAIIKLFDKMINREGIGDILADGCKRASEKLNKGKEFAIHAGGQELPAHDSRFDPGYTIAYTLEPTPGRHTNHGYTWLDLFDLPKIIKSLPKLPAFTTDKDKYNTDNMVRIRQLVAASQYMQFVNGIGACFFGVQLGGNLDLPAYVNAVTGWNKTPEDYLKIGERIQNMRQSFNIKHGIKPLTDFALPERALGKPSLKDGPLKDVTVNFKPLHNDFLDCIGWDKETAVPTKAKLMELGLEDVAVDIAG